MELTRRSSLLPSILPLANVFQSFASVAVLSHIYGNLSRGSHNLLSYVLLSDCLYGDCGILSHGKKVVKLFSASFPKYYFLIQQIFAPFVQDKKLLTPGLPFQAELLRSGEVFIQCFIMGSDPI